MGRLVRLPLRYSSKYFYIRDKLDFGSWFQHTLIFYPGGSNEFWGNLLLPFTYITFQGLL